MVEFERYNKYIVIKIDDLKLYADDILLKLDDVLRRIQYGREKNGEKINSYVVVNEDEPYAEEVWALIQKQWEKDQADKMVFKEAKDEIRNKLDLGKFM